MNTNDLDIRQKRLFDEIQIGRTAGLTCLESLEMVKLAYGRSEYFYTKDKVDRAKLEEAGVIRKRKHYTPAFKQRLYDLQGGACPWCPKPLLIPARKNEVDHINPNLADDERENRKNLCLAHPVCNQSKNAKTLYQVAKETGMTITEILSKGDHSEVEEEAEA